MFVLRRRIRPSQDIVLAFLASFWLSLPSSTYAQDPFNCKLSLDNGKSTYDLTTIAGEHVISRTRVTPPSSQYEEVRFDMCADLAKKEGIADGDQCAPGTRACLTATNKKADADDRVIYTVPLAVSSSLDPEVSRLSSPKGLQILFHGGSYPDTDPLPQSFNVTLLCDTSSSDPTFVSYDGKDFKIEWRAPAGCDLGSGGGDKEGNEEGDKEGDGESSEHVGSGIGWFFLLLVIAFAAYFLLGAYYNYSTYGASGVDLIPHKDFWREVPYMARDIASHLCSALRPSPRNGYISV